MSAFRLHTFPERFSDPNQAKVHEPLSNSSSPDRHDTWGCIDYPDGTIYEGRCLQGNPDGHGICYYASGDIFVGQFSKGSISGDGTVFFKSGGFFVGEFRDVSTYRGLYGKNGCEVWGVWEGGRCIDAHCVVVSEKLQQRHASLFSSVLFCIHHHFSDYRFHISHSKGPIGSIPSSKMLQTILPIPHPTDSRLLSSNSFTLAGSPLSNKNLHNECNNTAPDSGTLRNLTPNTTGVAASKSLVLKTTCEHCNEGGGGNDRDPKAPCMMMRSLPPNTIFACSAPVCNEYFSFRRFQLRFFVFLFPFLSLNWSPFAPFRVSTIDQEREFVVSGATLGRDFDSMNLTINCIALAVCCQVTSIVIVACKTHLGHVSDGRITFIEMAVPCVLWVVLALFCAGYNSYFRYPHFLERMDRQLTPKLSAFAANVVDARARVCISTWDEEGRGKVMNFHYLYRWLFFSVLSGILFSFAAPVTRVAYGHPPFGSGFSMCVLLLSSFATFLFNITLLYYVFKITDTQREIAAKLRVLSDLAYIEQRAIIRPSVYLRQTLDMGARLDTSDLFNGFTGWYTTRSLILYGSSYSNHFSRSSAMSIFATVMLICSISGISHAVSIHLGSPPDSPNKHIIAHSYAIFIFAIWGTQLTRYINASSSTQRELRHHQYIMNLTSMYHRVKHRDVEASEIIKHCCEMASAQDLEPQWFNFPMYAISMFFLVLLNMIGFIASILLLIREIQR
ncbi:unnamed protein product [Phytomonas sp. EM1]|nr:unnamed protein product [Phytomonas sp. EM1]|eukprot:CCW64964.1 unnamed protein product [Phytomonas sp. isolate EM1]